MHVPTHIKFIDNNYLSENKILNNISIIFTISGIVSQETTQTRS